MVKTSGVAATTKELGCSWKPIPARNIVLTNSCSLLHVAAGYNEFEPAILNHFAFTVEKVDEIRDWILSTGQVKKRS